MYKINLEENSETAFKVATDTLKKIFEGEGNYFNYRLYVLNLHSALELLFKKMLLEKSEIMIFSFNKFNELLGSYEKARKHNSLMEYIYDNKKELPHTVSFEEAYKRLAYVYKDSNFDDNFINALKKLNKLRNNITHFELSIESDELVMLNSIFIKCSQILYEYTWRDYIDKEFEEKIKNSSAGVRELILKDNTNIMIFKEIAKGQSDGWVTEIASDDFDTIADIIISKGNSLNKEKLKSKLELLFNTGCLINESISVGEHGDVMWLTLSKECYNLLK